MTNFTLIDGGEEREGLEPAQYTQNANSRKKFLVKIYDPNEASSFPYTTMKNAEWLLSIAKIDLVTFKTETWLAPTKISSADFAWPFALLSALFV